MSLYEPVNDNLNAPLVYAHGKGMEELEEENKGGRGIDVVVVQYCRCQRVVHKCRLKGNTRRR